jgi:hypothetical protein
VWGVRAALDLDLSIAVMIEVVENNAVSKASLASLPLMRETVSQAEIDKVKFCESPWMALEENVLLRYPPGIAVNAENIVKRLGCDSVINTTTVMADGKIMACCGLGTRTIAELEAGNAESDDIADVKKRLESDFLKRWLRNEGPERILQWAAAKNPAIAWENCYAHRCQACKRVYSDPLVREVIEQHHEEKMLDVMLSEWLLHNYMPEDEEVMGID